MANDRKYIRLYPERAVEKAREVLEALAPSSGMAAMALAQLDALGFPEDEPLLLLRGQDVLAPDAVRFYADRVEATDADLDVEELLEHADRMVAWTPRKLPD